MSSYLERYQNGEYIQVWNELVALGDAIMQEPLHTDAYAVAQETMRRARHNVELISERLENLGFKFCYPQQMFSPPSLAGIREMNTLERKIGAVPLSLRAWAEEVGNVNFMGSYPRLSHYADMSNPFFATGDRSGQAQHMNLNDLLQSPGIASLLSGNKSQGAQPPEQLNEVFSAFQGVLQKLMGQGTTPPPKDPTPETSEDNEFVSDPLVVDLNEITLDAYEEWQEYQDELGAFSVNIAPDIYHKSNISGYGGYEIQLPHAAADAPLLNTEWGNPTFVEYLRLSFEWGGFPGLQDYPNRDEALLASLKKGCCRFNLLLAFWVYVGA